MQSKKPLLTLGMLIGVFLAGAMYVYFTNGIKKTQTQELSTPVPTIVGENSQQQVKEITVLGTEYALEPKNLSFVKGERIKLIFVNNGNFSHNIVIDELRVMSNTIPDGQQAVVEFTADKTGSFKIYCSVGNHMALGMEGQVEIK